VSKPEPAGLGGLVFTPKEGFSNESRIYLSNKNSKMEAKYYKKTDRGYECELCPHYCILKEGKLSQCNTRIATDTKLNTIAYGNPCSVHIDPIEKKPLYHFYPESSIFSVSTTGCNLHCLNCQNSSISQVSPREVNSYDLMPKELVKGVIQANCKSIAYTYTEPTVYYEYAYDSAKLAHEKGIKNVLISAGYINEKPLRDIIKYIDAANIDLKSFNNDTYKKLNSATLQPVLDTIKILHQENVWLEITNLIIPGWTDNMDEIKKMCEWIYNNDLYKYPFHFSRFFPAYKLMDVSPTPVETLLKAKEIAEEAGIKHVYIGNVAGTKGSNTYCPKCKTKLIERNVYRTSVLKLEDGKCTECNEEINGVW